MESDQPRPLAYRTRHTYSYGSRATSTPYRTDGTAMPFKSLDLAIDISGLARTVTDSGGVVTTYNYDASGRLKEIQPSGMAAITYDYTPATSTVRAKVAVSQASTTDTLKSEIHFDSMGRPAVEKKTVESSTLRTKTTLYDAMGWKTSVTEWGSLAATVFSDFDAFGRAGTIVGPDDTTTTITYTGASAVTRTMKYQSPDGEQSTTVSEAYDPLGRLVAVTQNAGPTTASESTGSAVITSYGYDVADRLISVDIKPQVADSTDQQRRFTYDGRGFLTKETHPEVDSDITYAYDARGHAVSKSFTTASGFDLEYVYDAAERLTGVSSRFGSGFRVSKSFDFGVTGVGNGRLLTAKRYNYLPGSSEAYLVSEDYAYDANGRPSSRTTKIKRMIGTTETLVREFTQGWTYNDLALPSQIVYPQCAGCGSVARTITRGYVRGMLNTVTGFIDNIDYSPGGMTTKVVHSNGITDVIAPSVDGLSRPDSITFQGLCTPSQITIEPGDENVERGTTVTLNAGASGTAPVAYQWSKRPASSGTWTDIAGANGPTLSINVSDESYFRLSVSNECGTDISRDIHVTVYDKPAISVQPSPQTIGGGNTAQLSVTATGTAPLSYRWYRGMSGDTSQPTTGTQMSYTTPVLWATTSYWVRVSNALGHTVDSETATVTVELPAPANVEAIRMSTGIRVTWNASTGAGLYRVERRSGGGFLPVVTLSSSFVTYNDVDIEASHAYVYQIVALDSSGGSASAPSNQDFAVAIAYPAVQVSAFVSVDPLNELLAGINALRTAAWSGATPLTWGNLVSPPLPASGAIVHASAIQALRVQLNLARGSLGFPSLSFTDPVPIVIKAIHVNELQDGLR